VLFRSPDFWFSPHQTQEILALLHDKTN